MTRSIFYSVLATLAFSAPALADGIALTVEGVRNANGKLLIIVFDDAKAFDTLDMTKAVDYAEVPAKQGVVQHEFKALNKGPYAVLALHDENGDQNLNMEGERLLEGIGASGVPTPEFDTDFAAASVMPGDVSISLYYDK